MLRKERKWNNVKCSIKTTKGKKTVEDKGNRQKIVSTMVDINPAFSKITWNISGLNAPIKGQKLSEWIKKTRLNCMQSTRNPL